MGLSSRAEAASTVAARGAQLLAGLMVPGDRTLVDASLCESLVAPSHMHEFPFLAFDRTRVMLQLSLSSLFRFSIFLDTVSRVRDNTGVNEKKQMRNRDAAARRGLLDAPVRFRLTCFKQRASRLYSWPSFGESPRRASAGGCYRPGETPGERGR